MDEEKVRAELSIGKAEAAFEALLVEFKAGTGGKSDGSSMLGMFFGGMALAYRLGADATVDEIKGSAKTSVALIGAVAMTGNADLVKKVAFDATVPVGKQG